MRVKKVYNKKPDRTCKFMAAKLLSQKMLWSQIIYGQRTVSFYQNRTIQRRSYGAGPAAGRSVRCFVIF